MSPFNFQSIQSLEISAKDNPTIDVRDGHLILTAERGEERIMITAPLQGILPKVSDTTVKVSQTKRTYRVRSLGSHQGTKNGMAKLNDEKVCEIRALLEDKSFVQSFANLTALYTEIAEAYNVSPWAIRNIAEGFSWTHVKG